MEDDTQGLKGELKGKPPFSALQSLMEAAGYEVITIEPERAGLQFTGVINIQIAPAEYLRNSDFFSYPRIPQDLVSVLREYTAEIKQAENAGH